MQQGLSEILCVGSYTALTGGTMPRRKAQDGAGAPQAPAPRFSPAALDALLAEAGGLAGPAAVEPLLRALKRAVVERALGAELTHHLGYAPGAARPEGQPNHRNGTTPKRVLTDDGDLDLAVPRDRAGTFAPQLVPKHARRLPGFDAKVLSLYARGLTVRDIRAHLEELYGVEIAPDLVSTVTDAVADEVTAWQQRPLEPVYPVVVLDALRVKVRDEGVVRNKAVYLALGVDREGRKDVLGLWVEQTEGAKFWLRVLGELKGRGVEDILIALVDGLTGFPEAIHAVYPQAQVHQCVVHLVRQSLACVGWKERKAAAQQLRPIYQAAGEAEALAALDALEASPLGRRLPMIPALWRRHWAYVAPIFAYPLAVRRVLYTTNALESLNMQLRKATKTRGHFPSDAAAVKLLYLALRNVVATWQRAAAQWRAAFPYFAVLFGDRFTPAA
jgi:transposase-like protein